MGLTERRRQLLDTDRWRGLGELVERWYAQPLSDADGHAPLEIEQVARRLGTSLPAALVEWYELVGNRLRDVQDSPTLLRELQIENGYARVWIENQGVWSIVTFVNAGDDPHCLVDDKSYDLPDAPLSQILVGMLVSDTLVGAWAGRRIGVLGELRATVRGGYCEDFSEDQLQRLHARYRALGYARNPYFDTPYRGNDTTIVRTQEVAIEWITSTDEAFAALDDLLGLMPEGGEHEVVAALDEVAVMQQQHLVQQLPKLEPTRRLLEGVGHVGMAATVHHDDALRFHITTRQPRRVLEVILTAFAQDLLPYLTVATRPVAVSVFEVLFPEGKSTFTLPP